MNTAYLRDPVPPPTQRQHMSNAIEERLKTLHTELEQHVALRELREFGHLLLAQPLDPRGLRVFFATMRAFFHEIPGGILALSLRVSDDWNTVDPYEATAKGAYILFADVDEYGLHKQHKGLLPTHHQLFRDLTGHLGITIEDLGSREYILPQGVNLGNRTTTYYRHKSAPEGLGFHLASELTSQREFVYFLKGFQKHQEHYGITGEEDPVLDFFRVHTLVEPMHRQRAFEIIRIYAQRDERVIDQVASGALSFMDGFAELFRALNENIYGISYQRDAA